MLVYAVFRHYKHVSNKNNLKKIIIKKNAYNFEYGKLCVLFLFIQCSTYNYLL